MFSNRRLWINLFNGAHFSFVLHSTSKPTPFNSIGDPDMIQVNKIRQDPGQQNPYVSQANVKTYIIRRYGRRINSTVYSGRLHRVIPHHHGFFSTTHCDQDYAKIALSSA